MDVVGGGRADAGQFAVRVNTAAQLLAAGVPGGQVARVLVARFGVSLRQAQRYVDRARLAGRVAVPDKSVVFTVKLPQPLATQVRVHARNVEVPLSAVVAGALRMYLSHGADQRRRR